MQFFLRNHMLYLRIHVEIVSQRAQGAFDEVCEKRPPLKPIIVLQMLPHPSISCFLFDAVGMVIHDSEYCRSLQERSPILLENLALSSCPQNTLSHLG